MHIIVATLYATVQYTPWKIMWRLMRLLGSKPRVNGLNPHEWHSMVSWWLLTNWGKFIKRTFSVTVTAFSTTQADTSLELPLSTSNKFLSWCKYLSFSCHKCWHKRLILISCYNFTNDCIYFLFDRNTLSLISEIHYSEEKAK